MRKIVFLMICFIMVISMVACAQIDYQTNDETIENAKDGIHIYLNGNAGYEYFSPEYNLEDMIQTPSVQYNPKLGHMLAALSDSAY